MIAATLGKRGEVNMGNIYKEIIVFIEQAKPDEAQKFLLTIGGVLSVEYILVKTIPAISAWNILKYVNISNLIFDLVVPFKYPLSDGELCKKVEAAIQEKHPDYFAVISVDKDMIKKTV